MSKKILVSTLIFAFFATLSAQNLQKVPADQCKSVFDNIEKNVTSVKSIQCDFQQVKSVSMLADKSISSGKMYFSNGKLRWEYVSPYKYIFILNNQQVFIKSGEKTQKVDAQKSQIFKNIANNIINNLTGSKLSSNKDFVVNLYTQNGKYVVILIPKQAKMKKMFSKITLFFNNNQNMVEKIEMIETSGDSTTITFSNMKPNVKISDSVFVL